ncbi:DUF6446 family protein [Roseivivax sp. CAU 1753]
MTGKILTILIFVSALIAGAAMYYLQVYAYYEDVDPRDAITVLGTDGGQITVPVRNFEGIDADSSPIRFRACFDTDLRPGDLAAQPYPNAAPRNAPGWFDCFDAGAIAALMENGRAEVFTVARNIEFGIDRVVALTEDGRGYIWQEINDCGEKTYDGTPLGDDCPARD